MRHILYSHFFTFISKIEAILQFDFMQVNCREGLGRPRVTKGQIFKLVFLNKKLVFLNQNLRILKNGILFLYDILSLDLVVLGS